ncbi:tRNA preQ1(34) S-adenosylmethionine ribosyltransferase-isomerase QueA [Candidatus Gracilibacteria bacterium]|nr:tRNA preQ1(34) S-adenosylmethionine ribosyltransferase-isomerase QueA [Candidatus Gracilibacteria bacterium]
MNLSDFDYDLPQELIAQTPIEPRDHSRILKLDKDSGNIEESKFYEILDELSENDVLVLNKTSVINARLHGYITKNISNSSPLIGGRLGGGFENEREEIRVEIFLHKQLSENTWDCLVYPGKKLKPGTKVYFTYSPLPLGEGLGEGALTATIKQISDSGRIVEFNKSGTEFLDIIQKLGEIPLPPYIKEKLENDDRYQTVFHEVPGSAAAPTASLHFTPELLQKIQDKGVKIEKVLLHVGLGTFQGVQTEDIRDHNMHSEYIELENDVAERLNTYKSEGKRIIAVGTTAIRVLESFADDTGKLSPGKTETSIFIYPGYTWKFVDAIITNFHLPKSTLIMLVSSFAGKENTKKAYEYAIQKAFRFFSFGDAMFIRTPPHPLQEGEK